MNKVTAALYFAGMGIHVFRVKENGKTPLNTGWQDEATTDINTLKNWFNSGKYNLGLATGEISKFNVIDVDVKNGVDGRESLKERYGKIVSQSPILQFKTPTGGYHIPVKWTPETNVSIGSRVCGLDGVDVRGNGGYIVAAPSTCVINGKLVEYEINDPDLPMAEPIGWMEDLLLSHKNKQSDKFNPTQVMQGLSQGERNETLFRYACHLRAFDIDQVLLIEFVLEAARRCTPPFPDDEAMQVIKSAYSYPTQARKPNKPLTLSEVLS